MLRNFSVLRGGREVLTTFKNLDSLLGLKPILVPPPQIFGQVYAYVQKDGHCSIVRPPDAVHVLPLSLFYEITYYERNNPAGQVDHTISI